VSEFDATHAGELLSALLDGELKPDEQDRIREHVDSCDQCGAEYDELLRTRDLVRGLPSLEPPIDFVATVVRRRQRIFVYGALLSATAMILMTVVALTLTINTLPGDPSLWDRAHHAAEEVVRAFSLR